MTLARPYLIGGTACMFIGFVMLFSGIMADPGPDWFRAHGIILIGWVFSVMMALHVATFEHFGAALPPDRPATNATLVMTGFTLLGIGHLLQPSFIFSMVALIGATLMVAAAINISRTLLPLVPKDAVKADDPLTKGDAASWKHIKIALIMLPIGMTAWWLTYLGPIGNSVFGARLGLAGLHILLIGFGLLSLYGTGHIWVPRFSGVPAIAAGAIKGELHTTLLGIVGVTAGFLTGITGLILAFGPFVFLGFFTYMGVLGANIMRNKSITQTVTPEFVYVPWTFAGIFWLVSGVLLGLFMTVVPDALADQRPALAWIHVHINLFGGFILLCLGWANRIFPAYRDLDPPRFAGSMKAAFYLLNVSLALGVVARISTGSQGDAFLAAALLAVLGLLSWGVAMRGFLSSRRSAELP